MALRGIIVSTVLAEAVTEPGQLPREIAKEYGYTVTQVSRALRGLRTYGLCMRPKKGEGNSLARVFATRRGVKAMRVKCEA